MYALASELSVSHRRQPLHAQRHRRKRLGRFILDEIFLDAHLARRTQHATVIDLSRSEWNLSLIRVCRSRVDVGRRAFLHVLEMQQTPSSRVLSQPRHWIRARS